MRTQEAIDHFGSQQAVADALNISQPTIAGWGEYPPLPRQIEIEVATDGKLRAELTAKQRSVLGKPEPKPRKRETAVRAA